MEGNPSRVAASGMLRQALRPMRDRAWDGCGRRVIIEGFCDKGSSGMAEARPQHAKSGVTEHLVAW